MAHDDDYSDLVVHLSAAAPDGQFGSKRYFFQFVLDGFPKESGHIDARDLLHPGDEKSGWFIYHPLRHGRHLFKCLFFGLEAQQDIGNMLRQPTGKYRLRLMLDEEAPDLHKLPWELLDAGEEKASQLISASAATPFSRYLDTDFGSVEPLDTRPIRMLVALANPENLREDYGLAQLNLEEERRLLEEATETLDVELTFVRQPCTLEAIRTELKSEHGHHILHFVGHGALHEESGQTMLYLANEQNRVVPVFERDPKKAGGFLDMLDRARAESKGRSEVELRLVYLSSCQTAVSGDETKDNEEPATTGEFAEAYRGLAVDLIKAGMPAVIAMQDYVPIPTATKFSAVFYRQLSHHGRVDLAANEARDSVYTARLSDPHVPVLFSRLTDNRLFVQPSGNREDRAFQIIRKRYGGINVEPVTILIPEGEFWMGSSGDQPGQEYEGPESKIFLPAFRIGRFPVTNMEFSYFTEAKDHDIAPFMGWNGKKPYDNDEDRPVKGVTFYDALAYCEWLKELTGRNYRLPNEAEWEKAARGATGRLYPWGDRWKAKRCHHDPETIARVNDYPEQSVYGCYDLVGNVPEWTCSLWGRRFWQPDEDFCNPWKDDGRNNQYADRYVFRVCRGRSLSSDIDDLRCSARDIWEPFESGPPGRRLGFRVVIDLN